MTFFPAIERSGNIKFYILRFLPYYHRLYLAAGLFLTGLGLQAYTMTLTPGVYFIVGAMLLGLASGYQPKAETSGGPFWKETDWSALEEMVRLDRRIEQWDRAYLDITNARGFFLFTAVLIHALAVWFFLSFGLGDLDKVMIYLLDRLAFLNVEPPQTRYPDAGFIYLADVMIVAIPLWITGTRRILKKDRLLIRVNQLLGIRKGFEDFLERNGDTLLPMIETRTVTAGEGEVPTDVQIRVRYKDMPEAFYGLQAQVNINEVQGKSYPYFYCVLVAEAGSGLKEIKDRIRPPDKDGDETVKFKIFGLVKELTIPTKRIISEYQEQRDVEVLVVRQHTTKTSGYHVSTRMARKIFRFSYAMGRQVNDLLKDERPT